MKSRTIALASLALAAALSLGLAGCDQSGGKPRIGVALFSVDDGFVSAVRRALEATAVDKAMLSVLDGQNKQSVQSAQLDAMIADKAKAIIVNPVDPSIMGAMVFKAKAANVPIVLFSRDPSTLSIDMWDKAYFVGVKTEEADALQVEILSAYWKSRPDADKNRDGRIQYAVLRGNADALETKAHLESTQRSFDDAKLEAVMVAQTAADWTRIGARQKMSELIQLHGSKWIEAVLCGSDEMALGAIEALRTAGYFKGGAASYVPVVGVDGTRFALDAIAEGTLLGTARIDAASQGKAVFDIAYALARGESPAGTGWVREGGKYVLVPYKKVTIDNYASFLGQ
jgi:methyl-galactoside transport system substrate-binding protein